MSRLLFTHSYFLRFDPKQWKLGQPYAPLGTITAAAYLRKNGYEVFLHDVQWEESPAAIQTSLKKYDPHFLVIYEDGFNYLTKMCLTNMRDAAMEMIKMGKAAGCFVIVSGSDSTDHFDQYLQAGADVSIIGE